MPTNDYSFTPMLPSVTHYSRRANNPDATLYRSRYSADESSDAAYQKDLQNRLFHRRKRRLMMIVSLSMLVMALRLNNFLSSVNLHVGFPSKIATFDSVSMRESDGFFEFISPDDWDKLKQETKSVLNEQDTQASENIDNDLGSWWQNNWKVNFSCGQEVRIGNKFICNPDRVVSLAVDRFKKKGDSGKDCIVYVSGGKDVEFGNQFLDYSSAKGMEVGMNTQVCDVHIFNPNIQAEPRDNLLFHKWALYPSNKVKPVINGTSDSFKTLEETITVLNHEGKTISILSLDCEGCEWDMTHEFSSGPLIHQLLLQMHGVPGQAQAMFAAMRSGGYVITHREVEPSSNSEVWDYSFLRLSRSYFE